MIFYEDLIVGSKTSFGHYAVTREEVLAFASKYDPQPFHLSDEAAAQTHFGRIPASGWHTCAMMMAMFVEDAKQLRLASLGSPGIDELRWVKPVYPGDTLSCENELLSKRRSATRPEMGLTRSTMTVRNQHNDVVLTLITNGLIRTRDVGGTD